MDFIQYLISLPSIGVGLLVSILNIIRIIAVHNKNNKVLSANNYANNDAYDVVSKNSKYVRTYETKVKINNNK